MKNLPVKIDDELDAALDVVCAEHGLKKTELVVDIVRKYVETERLKRALQDPSLAALYEQLAAEDVSLAEEGMADYQQILESADEP
jgi:metal-responsive CopG/Arc/MetJ family transcriptional regulator